MLTGFAFSNIRLSNLSKINILVGKNGCGKSTLLKDCDAFQRQQPNPGLVRYITPERAGELSYQPHIDHSIVDNPEHQLGDQRRKNQFPNFRQQTAVQFRHLEMLVLREIQDDPQLRADHNYKFDTAIAKINALLDHIQIIKGDHSFTISDGNGKVVAPSSISSGEAELITLAIECLVFQKRCSSNRNNFLFLDEPDVHLHPDLQSRLCKFILEIADKTPAQIFVATHSTAFVAAMSESAHARFCFMTRGMTTLEFVQPDDILNTILPIFGAHPLSNIFNKATPLLLEGEDDERIWQQAVRSSQSRIRLHPVSFNGIDDLSRAEKVSQAILSAVYDESRAYSLRDKDDKEGEIADCLPVVRMRLACRTSENLLVTDEVLKHVRVSWDTLKSRIERWLEINSDHRHFPDMKKFADEGFPRRTADLKSLRNDLMGLMESAKPWEVVIGQAIGQLTSAGKQSNSTTSLASFLGEKVVRFLLA